MEGVGRAPAVCGEGDSVNARLIGAASPMSN